MDTYIFIKLLCVFFTLGFNFLDTEACDGYKINIISLEPCGQNSISVKGVKLVLNKECHVEIQGCGNIGKQIKSCKAQYDVKKKGMMVPFKGERDLCEELEKARNDPETKAKLEKHQMFDKCKCPIDPVEACAPEGTSIDVSKYKDKFRLAAGFFSGKVTLSCDSGENCFEFTAEFKRGK